MFTADQLEERRKYLGASESAAALGMSSFFSTYELYLSKQGKGKPIEKTIPMMVGQALEPVCIDLLEREDDLMVVDRQRLFVDDSAPWRRCTIDGYVHSESAIVEAKSSGDFRGWGDGGDEIPLPYLYNIAHSFMCIPEAKKAIFPVLIGGRTYRRYTVKRDNELIDLVRQGEEHFRKTWWEPGIAPPASTSDDIKLMYPRDFGITKTASVTEAHSISELKALKASEKVLKEKIERSEIVVKDLIGDAATLLDVKGAVLATWKTQSRDEFVTKASSFRVLRLK